MSLLQGADSAPVKKLSQPLINNKSSVFILPKERCVGLKALVITDQFFGKTLPLTKSIPHCLKNMMTIITRESINCIFMLGNVVHVTENNIKEAKQNAKKVISSLERIPLPVYIMGGDKDRRLWWELKYEKPGSNVHIVYDFLIRIPHPNPQLGNDVSFYLTHDCKNPIHIKQDEVESYAVELKRALKDEVHNEDYLLIGYCQNYLYNQTARVACIKEFSPDNHRNGYAIVSVTDSGFDLNIVGK